MNTLDRVKAVIGDHAGLPTVLIGDDQPLGFGEKIDNPGPGQQPNTGLGFDSLDKIELALKLGEHFGIDIPDEDVDSEALGTPSGLAAYIDGRLNPPARETDWLPPGLVTDENGGDHAPVEEISDGVRVQHEAAEPAEETPLVAAEHMVDPDAPPPPDYAAMSAGDMLAAVGTDATKWTEAFMQSFKAVGEADDGFMTAWFANAIAAGESVGYANGTLAGLGMQEPDPGARDTAWGSRHHPDRVAEWAFGDGIKSDPREDMLRQAMRQFRFYEQQHSAKGTPESDRKAEVNARYAAAIFEVLNGRPVPAIDSDRPKTAWEPPEVRTLDAAGAEGGHGGLPDAGLPLGS